MKISSCVSLYLLLAAACVIQATYRQYSRWHCSCNGRSQYCLQDRHGLHCINCQGNTAGRHCERCKDGFYQQVTGLSCSPCGCDPVGSINSTCDSRGRCSCREGVTGEKCNRCTDGPIGPNGCTQRRQLREDSGRATLPCFCYGHSSRCSAQSGYSIRPITSTFTDGPDGWKTTALQDVSPNDVLFHWSPKHQDLEVTSKNSLPVYLNAPGSYLGNQLLSYGQNLSFSLRVDHSVWQPSYDDVILEGAGLQVATSLDALRSAASCRRKMDYSFRLDEQPSSGWRPRLSTLQFQMLLQNLTAIKIRATFGKGRGYLDNVQLVSAERGGGRTAHWVWSCSCPLGYEGDFCERCAAGFKRTDPAEGAFSSCQLCTCRGGSCDPHTGDCYSADETAAERTCPLGFYQNPSYPGGCFKCPCPDSVSCTLRVGSRQPQCDQCPFGSTGPRCDVCQEGFYGDPAGQSGVQRACRPCECNGHIRVNVPGSCDGSSGECLKCVNNTRGRSCESCLPDFYHSRASDACRPCDCDLRGSESTQCDRLGRCQCKPGFEGVRCQLSNCPACFNSIKKKMKESTTKLEEMASDVDRGHSTVNRPEMEAALRNVQKLLDNLQLDMEKSTGLEKKVQDRLSSTNEKRITNRQHMNDVAEVEDDVQEQHQLYNRKVDEVQDLLEEIQQKLDQAKNELRSAEVPVGDAPQGSRFSDLLQTAGRLADLHQREAGVLEQISGDALEKSAKSLNLAKTLMGNEKKVKELFGDLKNTYDQTSAQVKGLENRAGSLSSDARRENTLANIMLKDIPDLEQKIPSGLKEQGDNMASLLKDLTGDAKRTMESFDEFQKGVDQNQAATESLLAKGRASGQQAKNLMDRIEVARDDTKDALQRISANADDLTDSLDALKGFNQQINTYKAEADDAIRRLNGINSTIRQAVSKNSEAKSVLRDMTDDFDQTLANFNTLENLVNGIEGAFRSLPNQKDRLAESTKLKRDSEDLKLKLDGAGRDLDAKFVAVRRLEEESGQAAAEAAGALTHAQQSRVAVAKTLRDVNSLLAQLNQTGGVDQERLQQMEDTLIETQRDVEQRLGPWLREVEVQEAAQKRRLFDINTDIVNILADIENLNQILAAIPEGCYNTAPIENP